VIAQVPAFGTTIVPSPSSPALLTVSSGAPLGGAIAKIVVEPATTTRLVGEDVAYRAFAVLADGTARDITLAATWTATPPGPVTLSGSAVHAAHAGATSIAASLEGASGSATLTVAAPFAEAGDPDAIIASPQDGASVVGPVDVTGTASDDHFLRYELGYAADGDDAFTPIAEGSAPVVGGVLGRFDPTVLENGVYTLQLSVYDRGGNVAVARVSVTVEGNRKVGAFTLAYNDLTVPLAGIPIQIARTYDSRDKAKGDFGIGWTLGLKAVRVTTTRAPGDGWEVYKSGINYELDPKSNRYITVTLPSGRVETFDLRITPSSSPLVPFETLRASVVARPGTQGTLEILSNPDLLIVDPQPGPVTLVDDATLESFAPDRFRYRQRDGTEFIVTRSHGVESAKDANGNSITVTPGGISHSTGVAVTFARDAQDRITAITDPAGNTRTYAYSGEGDLIAATDRTGNTTKYFYDRAHGVVRIEDPLGRTATRTEYDDAGRVVSITDAAGNTTQYRHDLDGRQEQVEDALGRISILTYDERGNVVARTDPLGHTTTATYDARDRMTGRTDALGATTRYEYDDHDNPTRVIDALGHVRTMTYDADGNLAGEVDARGKATSYRYDANRNLVGTTDALGRAFGYGVDGAGNVTSIQQPGGASLSVAYEPSGRRAATVDESGHATALSYDAAGNLTQQASPDGGVATIRYDAEGRVVGRSDGARATTYAYDAAGALASLATATGRTFGVTTDEVGRITGIAAAGGASIAQAYDAVGNIVTTTNAAGVRVDYRYDAANRLTVTTDPSGVTERRAYDAAGRVVQITDARGYSRYFEWDALGRLASSTDANGGVTHHVYDEAGNEVATTDALGRTTRFAYDDIGRLTSVTYADGAIERQDYDDAGNIASRTDAKGATTRLRYDAMGRLIGVTDALGGTLAHEYAGSFGLPSRSVDARGAATRYAYDGAGRLLETQFPDGGVETRTYDALGQLATLRNAAGETTRWHRDGDGRADRVTLADGSTLDLAYTADGQRASMTGPRGTTTFAYDATGRVARVTEPDGAYVRYAYDSTGMRTTVAHRAADGSERVLEYVHDALGRIVQMTDSDGGVSRQTFDAVGNLTRTEHPDGVVTTLTYDVRDRVRTLTHRGPGGVLLAQETCTRDANGDLTRVDREDGSHVDYTYDALRRVTGEIAYAAGGGVVTRVAYAYDAAGNRTTAGSAAAPVAFGYDAAGRLVDGDGVTYGYDAAGRRTLAQWNEGGSPRTARYRWDSLGRLVGFDDGASWTYDYDADGLRMRKAGGASVTTFVTDRSHPGGFAQLLRASDGAARSTFDWMDGLAGVTEGGLAMSSLADAQGSVRALAGPAGGIVDTFAYDAFGRTTSHVGSAAALHRYAGEVADAESALVYLRARYYDPRTGGFLSRDPLQPPLDSTQGANPYLYALANPVNRKDPSGEETIAELSVSQSISSTIDKARLASNTRRTLARTWDTAMDISRIFGGIMGLETVAESITTGGRRAARWFGVFGVTRAALDEFAAGLGEGANTTMTMLATAGMAKTAFDMLGGKDVEIHVQGFGVLLASSLDEAQSDIRVDSTAASGACAKGDLAYASRTASAIAMCTKAAAMPPTPDVSTLTTPNRASIPGILLHEYSHLSLNTRDDRYSCHPEGARLVLTALGAGNLRALGNADSYRCWAEDYQVGALTLP
jgi:RHS repeat-associated protein